MAKLLKSLPPLVEQTSSPTGIASSGMDSANIQNAPENPEIQSGTGPSCATSSFPAIDPFIFDDQLNDFFYDPQSLDFTGLGSLEPY
ncbi:hypothetical protein DIS24_g742 [Lasiodiplodia hormozganensis]|uniref:Uncharacterized protein n=1 Tax=Lasiodiplodia hormozganensis TaxID=869390 RepID=A0AA39Z510_9PEZI|nr:hypothetical protein DIS24_g742 [Lasiodiplodia hormozganensis]